MSYNVADVSRSQPIYTSSGIDASLMSAQHHVSFIPVPLTHNVVDTSHNTGYQTNVTSSNNNISTEQRPKPQMVILEKLKQLRDEGKYCDLFIDVKGMRFFAHKALVAAWSPYFDEALTSTNFVDKDLLIVHYDSYEVFADLLEFFYTGTVAPRETNFIQLLHLAVSFRIDLLKTYCEEFLRCNLHLGNFVGTYFLSRKYSLDSLEEFIVGFLQSNLSDAVKQSEFLQMSAERFHSLLSRGPMIKLKPEIKLFLVISWVGFEVQPREKFLVLLLKHIDWSSVASDFLLEISRTENFFTTHESSLYLLLQTLFSSGISLGPYKESFASLRHTYSHLLNEVVHSGIILPEIDEFVATTAIGTSTRHVKFDTSLNTDSLEKAKLLTEVQPLTVPLDVVKPIENCKSNTEEGNIHVEYNESSGIVDDLEETSYMSEQKLKQSPVVKPAVEELKQDEDIERLMSLTEKEIVKKIKVIGSKTKKKKGKVKKKKMDKSADTLAEPCPAVSERQLRSAVNGENDKQLTKVVQEADNPKGEEEELDEEQMDDDVIDKTYEEEPIDGDSDEELEDQDEPVDDETENEKQTLKRLRAERKAKERFNCPHCKYSTIVENRYKKHLKWNHENDVIFECNICHDFQTKSNRFYNDHMKIHFTGPPFVCEVFQCGYSSEKFQSLLIHRMKHDDQRPFPCDICGARFRTRNNLYAHIRTHTGEKPWKCRHCPKSFATKNTLDQHSVTHDDLRPYLCDLCGFATKYQSHLTAHRRTHTGEMFKCEYPGCKYESPKRSQLKCHMRTHLGIRSFTCAECGKSFIEKSHLKRHETIHWANKPFKCSLCDYCSARKDKLKHHMRCHEAGREKKPKGKRTKTPADKLQKPIVEPLSEAMYIQTQGVPKNFDHSGYTIQGISADGSTPLSLDDIRRAQFGGSNLEGITIQVPISMEHLVIPLDETKTSTPRPLPATSPVTPVTLIPEDHQTYIQNVMTQVPVPAGQQHQEQQPSTSNSQDYGGLGAFMALF